MARRKPLNRAVKRKSASPRRRLKKRREGVPTGGRRVGFTVSDLVKFLRSTPQPDAEYWNLVEAITRNQPVAQPPAWDS